MAKRLNREERQALGTQALTLRARRIPVHVVAERLGVNPKTVPGLIKEALGDVISKEAREEALYDALATLDQVERRAWSDLDRTELRRMEDVDGNIVTVRAPSLNPTSYNTPKLLAEVRECMMARVKILGLAEPEEINLTVKTPAERIQAYEERRRDGSLEVLRGGKAS